MQAAAVGDTQSAPSQKKRHSCTLEPCAVNAAWKLCVLCNSSYRWDNLHILSCTFHRRCDESPLPKGERSHSHGQGSTSTCRGHSRGSSKAAGDSHKVDYIFLRKSALCRHFNSGKQPRRGSNHRGGLWLRWSRGWLHRGGRRGRELQVLNVTTFSHQLNNCSNIARRLVLLSTQVDLPAICAMLRTLVCNNNDTTWLNHRTITQWGHCNMHERETPLSDALRRN